MTEIIDPKVIDWSKAKVRCSGIGKIMTDPRGGGVTELQLETIENHGARLSTLTDKQLKEYYRLVEKRDNPELSDTCLDYLDEVYIFLKYGIQKELINKFITKGLAVEQDSITLYSRLTGIYYVKNEDQLFNEYLSGTPDLFDGDSLKRANRIIDIKSSWDLMTYRKTIRKGLTALYNGQLQGYMALTGAREAELAYCLIDTPEPIIFDEIKRLKYKMGVIDEENDEVYLAAVAELERSMRFEHIPIEERVNRIIVQRDNSYIDKIYDRVKRCRKHMVETFK